MGQRKEPLRRAAKVGVFVASLVLALSMPGAAFAAGIASFSGQTPRQGSSTTNTKPMVSIVVYDTYGVRGIANYSMTINGQAKKVAISYFPGYGYRKFRLSYQVRSDMAPGLQKVVVNVKDLRSSRSSYAWNFTVLGGTVLDSTPPVTTSDAVLSYAGSASIHLSATDNVGGSGVAHTYYKLDGGAQAEGTTIAVSTVGSHTLEFWSVDMAGNTELHHFVSFAVTGFDITPPVTTSDAVADYIDSATLHLSATDNLGGSGVAHTYYKLDGGAQTEGSAVTVWTVGSHTLEFWSVDVAGNTELHHFVSFDVAEDAMAHIASGPCFNSQCHSSNVALIHHGLNEPGCLACHGPGITPSTDCATCHPNVGTLHDPVLSVFTANGHATKLVCSDCHDQATGRKSCGTFGCHNLWTASTITRSDGTMYTATNVNAEFDLDQASRHNVVELGGTSIGMKSKFDGSQGITLYDTAGNVVVTTWGVPTVNVFKAGVLDSKGQQMGPNSVISCVDCHSGSNLAGASGPHGSSAQWLIDPDYPADYGLAVLSHASTVTSGIKLRTSVATSTTTASLVNGGVPGTPTAVICAKCHDLYNVGTGLTGTSNRAHGSHHFDRVDGSADCISCHIAVPHGWKRPRLLLDSSVDKAPYKDPNIRGRIVSGQFVGVGLGPISAKDDHSLDASGSVPWTEAMCIACGDEHEGEANLTGAFSITTTGTIMTWMATTDPSYGIAEVDVDVDLDGVPEIEQTVDLYSATTLYQQPVLQLTGLSDTTHTIDVEWTGTKNVASTGTYISLDKFVVAKGDIEQTSNSFTLDGVWTTVTNAGASGGSFAITNDPGNDAKLR